MSDGYRWLNDYTQQFLEADYLLPNQSVQQRVAVVGNTAERILKLAGFAAKFEDYFAKGWFSLSTPVWTNFGTDRGLPISCYGSYMDDDSASILRTEAEVGMMTKQGGGTAAYFGNLRGRGASIRNNGTSSGSAHFAQSFESKISVWSQGATRRGNFAGYWPIDHPDIMEVLSFRTEGSPIQDIYYGVCISDKWMQAMVDGDSDKRTVWAKVLQSRANTGVPYLIFTDNANANTADCYSDQGLRIYHSQLCTEVFLPTKSDWSFVCCLASMNILYYEEWKGTDCVEVVTYLLDAVMEEFIRKASSIPFMERAVAFAKANRALGIGWMGWHSYLQSKRIPFESMEAKAENIKVAKLIRKQAYAASAKLATEYGEPKVCKGYGRRNATLLAIAPTKSSSFILGQVSEGIEPHRSNYYIRDLQKGKFTIRNAELESLLEGKGKNTPEVWESILKLAGSVQHLKCLTANEKAVFKTFAEISPMEVVQQAAQRQKYIDQGQSLNLLIDPKTPVKDVNALIIGGWKLGIKSFYYQISVNAAQQLSRSILACSGCEA